MTKIEREGAPTYHSFGAPAEDRKPSVAELEARRKAVIFYLRAALAVALIALAMLAFVCGVLGACGLFQSAIEAVSR